VVISPSPSNCKKPCSPSMGMSEEEKPTLEDYESKDKSEKREVYFIYLAQIDKFECF
jgi:hypothetical protein